MSLGKLTDNNEIKAYVEDVELFVGLIKNEPSALHTEDLAFFKEYLEGLGAKIPAADANYDGATTGAKAAAPAAEDDDIEEVDATTESSGPPPPQKIPNEPKVEEVVEEEEVEEEEEEMPTDPDVIEGDSEPFPAMPAEGVEPDYEAAGEKKMAANDAKGNGDFEKAMGLYSEALLLAPSALTHANRADMLLKCSPKRPNAAIQDCNAALQSNPDSAKALKMRGKAHRFLGNWEEAAKDLSTALNIDFDESTQDLYKHVKTFSDRITASKNKERNKALEKEKKERFAKAKAAAAARKRAQDEQDERDAAAAAAAAGGGGGMGGMGGMPGMGGMGGMGGGMPGGMGGMGGMGGGMPAGMAAMFQDPEVMAAMQNPKVMAALAAAKSDPSKLAEAMKDPEVAAAMAKIQEKMGGGGMGGMGGGMGGGMPGMGMGGGGGMPGMGMMGGMPGMGGMGGGMPGMGMGGGGMPGGMPGGFGGGGSAPAPAPAPAPSFTDDVD